MRCWPSGIPEKNNIPDGLKLVQTPDLIIFLHESRTIYRQIFTDGRPLPEDRAADLDGLLDRHGGTGDTLVVETIGQNGRTWLDMRGLPATEALRVIGAFLAADHRPHRHRRDDRRSAGVHEAVDRQAGVDACMPDTDLIESICEENSKDLPHMVGK